MRRHLINNNYDHRWFIPPYNSWIRWLFCLYHPERSNVRRLALGLNRYKFSIRSAGSNPISSVHVRSMQRAGETDLAISLRNAKRCARWSSLYVIGIRRSATMFRLQAVRFGSARNDPVVEPWEPVVTVPVVFRESGRVSRGRSFFYPVALVSRSHFLFFFVSFRRRSPMITKPLRRARKRNTVATSCNLFRECIPCNEDRTSVRIWRTYWYKVVEFRGNVN